MENLTFDTLNAAWNRVRMQGIPGLRDASRIVMQRVDETPETFTVMFRGFDQALADPQDAPLVKRFLISWVKRFAETQIARGDEDSLILRITKPVPALPPRAQPAAPAMSESLVHIAKVKKIHGY